MTIKGSADEVPGLSELGAFLGLYGVEPPLAVVPFLPSLVVATYLVETQHHRYLVRRFDPGDGEAAAMAARLLDCLCATGIPCASPVPQSGGKPVGMLDDHPALVLKYPSGEVLARYTQAHCEALGTLIARLHLTTGQCGVEADRAAVHRLRERRERALSMVSQLPSGDATVLQDEMRYQGLYRFDDLPQGLICGAGIQERVLFEKNHVTGVLGLEQAQPDVWLWDLANVVTDCCENDEGALDKERVLVLLNAYHKLRPLNPIERGAWPVMLRVIASQRWVHALEEGEGQSSSAWAGRSRLLDRIAQESLFLRLWPR